MTFPINYYIVKECNFEDDKKWHSHGNIYQKNVCTSFKKTNEEIVRLLASNSWYLVLPPLPEIIHMHLHKPQRYGYSRNSKNNSWHPRHKGGGPYCTKTRCVKVRVIPIEES
jgi:hypothetical protein